MAARFAHFVSVASCVETHLAHSFALALVCPCVAVEHAYACCQMTKIGGFLLLGVAC